MRRALVFGLGFVLSVECVGQRAFRSSSAPGEHTAGEGSHLPKVGTDIFMKRTQKAADLL